MKILISDVDPVSRALLKSTVFGLGHDVDVAADAPEAYARLQASSYDVVISDCGMPGKDGVDLCHSIRANVDAPFCYVMLLTPENSEEDVVVGIMSGADDFLVKPLRPGELEARIHAAQRVVDLERTLGRRVDELGQALDELDVLRDLLPVCMYCHGVRRGDDVWQDVVQYMMQHTNMDFTHTICPDCYESRAKPELAAFSERMDVERRLKK